MPEQVLTAYEPSEERTTKLYDELIGGYNFIGYGENQDMTEKRSSGCNIF